MAAVTEFGSFHAMPVIEVTRYVPSARFQTRISPLPSHRNRLTCGGGNKTGYPPVEPLAPMNGIGLPAKRNTAISVVAVRTAMANRRHEINKPMSYLSGPLPGRAARKCDAPWKEAARHEV